MAQMRNRGDFLPTASWKNLQLRAKLLRRVRGFFDTRGFLEVDTPILSADTVVDRHLDPFRVEYPQRSSPTDSSRFFWLQTSPEFAMKRLLAAGAEAIYQVTRAFRQAERGALHNPEFTVVEWYRTGDSMSAGMDLLSDLCREVLGSDDARRVSYADAFQQHVGLDPHAADPDSLMAAANRHNVAAPVSLRVDDRDGWLDLLLAERVGPQLGHGQPIILYDYPASQAALARVRPGRIPLAERFELYVSGIELANGYHELLDATVLRERNRETNTLRQSDGKCGLPEESRLLAAMEAGLPASTGVALGFDRVVMLAAGAKSLDEVIAFPIDRA